jgi:hypothetical protein
MDTMTSGTKIPWMITGDTFPKQEALRRTYETSFSSNNSICMEKKAGIN